MLRVFALLFFPFFSSHTMLRVWPSRLVWTACRPRGSWMALQGIRRRPLTSPCSLRRIFVLLVNGVVFFSSRPSRVPSSRFSARPLPSALILLSTLRPYVFFASHLARYALQCWTSAPSPCSPPLPPMPLMNAASIALRKKDHFWTVSLPPIKSNSPSRLRRKR